MIKIMGMKPMNVSHAERVILRRLNYELGWPGPTIFLWKLNKIDNGESQLEILSHYFMELMLVDERFVSSRPSLMAAAAYCLAREILVGNYIWASTLYNHYFSLGL
jgi:hypothetical protein